MKTIFLSTLAMIGLFAAPSKAELLVYNLSAATQQSTAVTGTLTFDTTTLKYTTWDITVAADATAGVTSAIEFTPANQYIPGTNDANGIYFSGTETLLHVNLLSSGTNYYLPVTLFGSLASGAATYNINGSQSAIINQTTGQSSFLHGNATLVTPEPATASLGLFATGALIGMARLRKRKEK